MIGIIGKKLGMTQIFNAQGQQVPCTVVEATPNPVVQVMDVAQHGFRRGSAHKPAVVHALETPFGQRVEEMGTTRIGRQPNHLPCPHI